MPTEVSYLGMPPSASWLVLTAEVLSIFPFCTVGMIQAGLSLSPQSTHAVLPGVYCGLMSVLISWAALKFSFPGYGDLFAIHQQYYTWFRAMCAMYGLDSTKHHIWFRPCTAVWFGPHINYGRGHNLSCMAAGQNPPPLVHMQIL